MKTTSIVQRHKEEYITSFDIGVRNLACCVLCKCGVEMPGKEYKIKYWNVFDLTFQQSHECKECKKTAKYFCKEEESFFCKIHSRKKNVTTVEKVKVKSLDMQTLCSRLVDELDKVPLLCESSVVLIENQPSSNPKMKNVSYLLYCYFVIHKVKKVIFVNPRNKLEVYDGPYVQCNLKGQYARNKFYGKVYCRYIIRNQPSDIKLFESHKKKDDLADSFLQGVWFLCKNKIKQSSGKTKINYENNWNRFKNIRAYRGSLKSKVTLSNLKYFVQKDKNWCANARLRNSAEFFFGSVEFLENKLSSE